MYMLLALCKPAVSARSAVTAKVALSTCCLPCASLQFQHEVLLLLKWRDLRVTTVWAFEIGTIYLSCNLWLTKQVITHPTSQDGLCQSIN